ncbi:unnamed protein product [marine sediment metagenome]|uniref:STAS domain-containing protein n=1 Tax=marine sediment metagenome TaxID=412755 RepID=X1KW46_9ZZZZ
MIDLHIKTQRLPNGIMTISAEGSVDAYTADRLEKVIKGHFTRKDYRLIMDLTDVDYLGSAGLAIFIRAIGTAWENNGDIVIMRPRANVRDVFDLVGLSRVFTLTNNIKSALGAFKYYLKNWSPETKQVTE